MAQTTLFVRVLQMTQAKMCQSAILRITIVILLLAGSMVSGCGSGGDGEAVSTDGGSGGEGTPSGPASASLAWDPVVGVVGYFIHYGTQSPNASGSCAYSQSTFSSTPTVTVTGLAANTTYYLAVSSYNGLESPCSGEVSTVTDTV